MESKPHGRGWQHDLRQQRAYWLMSLASLTKADDQTDEDEDGGGLDDGGLGGTTALDVAALTANCDASRAALRAASASSAAAINGVRPVVSMLSLPLAASTYLQPAHRHVVPGPSVRDTCQVTGHHLSQTSHSASGSLASTASSAPETDVGANPMG
eukprot:CAMPEP_0175878978 /NCGR_PEP_ID=MMETSP0107_2-20121207/41506_1 /TAXON_ID=195067 ORGANISM="Goniomonas pacifica, Strain CCMP1869" /NCGR_SAMPLE_ID=MMETSP0107_2 /ASSEMBLY_ACC=CAM_ASM_000203 /LENGTH=155 /DNA_ID=CAMNT_0017198559 /DNA_START=119 /DNA_END=588 /DNA_ORIENTATION=+